jgi:tetratricopeptide (TPR) repeat protein
MKTAQELLTNHPSTTHTKTFSQSKHQHNTMKTDGIKMNKTIRSNSYTPCVERPMKKIRTVATVDTVAMLNDMGISNFSTGDYAAAQKCFSQALCRFDVRFLCSHIHSSLQRKSCESSKTSTIKLNTFEVKETSDSPVVDMLSSLDIDQRHEYDEGMRVYGEPLPIDSSTQAECIASVLFYNIAQTHSHRGEYETARRWFEQSLSESEETSDNLSYDIIVNNLHNLGHCAYKVGQKTKAMQYYEKALSLILKLNLDNNCLAASLNCLGVLCFHRHTTGDMTKTLETFQQSLEIYRSSFESDPKAIATVLNNIGRIYYLRSEFKEALLVYKEALTIRRQALGDLSIDVAATVYNMGQTYHQLGDLDKSMEHYRDFLIIAKSCFGSDTRDIALVYKGIAEIHQEKSELKLALHYFTQALRSQRASVGNLYPEVAATLNKLGNLCYEMQDYVSAMKFYKEGLEVENAVLPSSHAHIVITLTNIAHIYKHLGDYHRALRTYKRVMEMQSQTFGAESIKVAETLSSIGLMQYHIRDFEASFNSYQEALRIRREYHGADEHPDVASTLNSVGLVLFKQDMFELARKCFAESLRIRRKVLGENHRDVAILWYNIATIYFETGEDDLAIQYYKETLRIERVSLGFDHPDVVLTLQHLGQVFQKLGKLNEAVKYFNEALELERQAHGREEAGSTLGKILNLIGNVHLQQGNTKEMMACYIEASRIYVANRDGGVHGMEEEALVISGYNFYGLSKMHPPCAPVA